MPTPHISAADGDFAPDILLPGDPRRATRIAETFLDDARLVTDVRAIVGYTGTLSGAAGVGHGDRHGDAVRDDLHDRAHSSLRREAPGALAR